MRATELLLDRATLGGLSTHIIECRHTTEATNDTRGLRPVVTLNASSMAKLTLLTPLMMRASGHYMDERLSWGGDLLWASIQCRNERAIAASFAMSAPFGPKSPPAFSFAPVERKKVVAAFDGGRITSNGGVMLLGTVERQLGIADALAPLISDPRNPLYVTHSVNDILRARMLAIACGYEDGDDLDLLRTDPAFKVACGRLPDSGDDLCSQPTVSRWENAPTQREVVRMIYAMIDLYCRSYDRPPAASPSISTTPAMWRTAISNWRCFTPTTTSGALCRSTSTTLRTPGRWWFCFVRADAERRGDPRPSAMHGAAHSPPLATDAHHHSRRQSLRPP